MDTKDQQARKEREFPDDLWTKCPKCNELLYSRQLENNLKVCTKCNHHFRLTSDERIAYLVDDGKVDDGEISTGTFQEHGTNILPIDPIGFENLGQKYAAKLIETQR